ncbi:putative polygalacturonase At3g15720 [Tasmannia lanceolata]|uniref:putative polygalacturonase At3g15720 n=1 Tax=Tasmannia lanceolata TaxID=3420 RepID=UPI0040638142
MEEMWLFLLQEIKSEVVIFLVSLCVASLGLAPSSAASPNIFNVDTFGAVGDGKTDDSHAFLRAWGAACAAYGGPTIYIPGAKIFLLKPIQFQGPCNSSINIQVLGNLVAPRDMWMWKDAFSWLLFYGINQLTIYGSGKIDGQGSLWWAKHCQNCKSAPTAMSFQSLNGLVLKGLRIVNSPRNHISINGCTDVSIHDIGIWAPEDSPNTDGINIGNSQHVEIRNSNIGTGDDCISVLSGTSNVSISRINCGPGHGISIGSLGQDGSQAMVEKIHVEHCTFNGTSNGARIKTWEGGSGYARGITFEHIYVNSVEIPILIDQHYFCSTNCQHEGSAVRVSDVKFVGIHGTATLSQPIKLTCSNIVPCTDIVLSDIILTHVDPKIPISSNCTNAHGPPCPGCIPSLPCLGK